MRAEIYQRKEQEGKRKSKRESIYDGRTAQKGKVKVREGPWKKMAKERKAARKRDWKRVNMEGRDM